ncbi:MAG: hypothetical protein ACJAZO_002313 [Myxococcota bacterium]|jgi:hypothetical protein
MVTGCASRKVPVPNAAVEVPPVVENTVAEAHCNLALIACCDDMASLGGTAAIVCPFLKERDTPCDEAMTTIAVLYRDTSIGQPPETCPSLAPIPVTKVPADAVPDDCVRPLSYGPVRFADENVDKRRGLPASLQDYRAAPYTIETCSTAAHYAYLTTLACPNGAPAFMSQDAVYDSRQGQATDRQGRCGTIVDLYTVPCVGGPIDVYMDGYYCTVDESF